MSFDKDTRNLLAKTVAACRRRLIEDVTDQLRGVFGLHPDGTVLPLDKLTHLSPDQHSAARRLRDLLDHYTAGAAGKDSDRRKAAYERMVLEISFTVLNRSAAMRLCEERGLVVECVRKGTTSAGFQMFERISGGAVGGRYDTYRVFLECMFDELASDLGVLFDRMTPQSAVFPSERCMEDVIAELNKPELTHLWTEDETIGWVYQYFNPPEERKAMREASQAPRNSRELAVRNQFFTPRYVVEFLTDNTLGRIWYEMRKGSTALREECRYLVRRPNEVFLAPGGKAPAVRENEMDLSQEEMLKQPAYIEHRPKKDPRDLRVLDPACGSGHFLLYAFDLLEQIYEEAWTDPESPKSETTGGTLQEDFKTPADLRQEVPKLIVEHNLHGIDIDPRAVQIAALALWLRAQKTWKNLGLKASERPRIARSNIVTAEPMPGEEDMRREFTAGLKPRVLGQIVDEVFEKMKLAGEAGSLLKIEEEIKDAVAAAGKQWREGPKPEQQLLFLPGMTDPRPKQQELRFDVKGITGEKFWEQAEDRILDALKDYAEQAENGRAVRRRLFAEDAAKGFAFIDLCRQRYDVVLMNPPFGDASLPAKPYIENAFGDTKGDVYKTFVEGFQDRLVPSGMLGIISSRMGFFLGQSADWRKRVLLRLYRPICIADLGYGVLDAMVETAAYVLRSLSTEEDLKLVESLIPNLQAMDLNSSYSFSIPGYIKARGGMLKRHQAEGELRRLERDGFVSLNSGSSHKKFVLTEKGRRHRAALQSGKHPILTCYRLIGERDKATSLALAIHDFGLNLTHIARPETFQEIPGAPFAYFVSERLRQAFVSLPVFEGGCRQARQGLATANDFRFIRSSWEIYPRSCGWHTFAKGGAYSPYYGSIHLMLNWKDNGAEINTLTKPGSHKVASRPQNTGFFFRPGITWPRRTQRGLNVRVMPAGCVFADKGPTAFVKDDNPLDLMALLAIMNSAPFKALVDLQMAFGSFEVGVIQRTPVPEMSESVTKRLASLARDAWGMKRSLDTISETSNTFVVPALLCLNRGTLAELPPAWAATVLQKVSRLAEIHRQIDQLCLELYGISSQEGEAICKGFGEKELNNLEVEDESGESTDEESAEDNGIASDTATLAADLMCWAAGTTFGRWDIRLSLDLQLVPADPEPFAPLPVCSPGMLVGPDGLPAEPNRIVSKEWLRARPDANTLPPDGSVKTPSIPDSEYPLRISWDGVLVDDPGFNGAQPHRDDIVRRVREVFDLLWKEKAHEIEQEACDILGVSDLRDYFRKPAGFFQDHLKRYSKSRRKAPIYLPLSTASGSYTLWLYYHRLTDQTLYAAVNKYVEPKISEVERGIAGIENNLKSVSGRDSTRLTDRLGEARTFLGELRDLREELIRIAALPFKPDLNDGVIINAAPFHNLFRLRSWAKDAEDCWRKLEKGGYDWAHLAYTIRPDRVREVCKTDRSIAIAHGLEDLCKVEVPGAKKKGGPGRRKREAAR